MKFFRTLGFLGLFVFVSLSLSGGDNKDTEGKDCNNNVDCDDHYSLAAYLCNNNVCRLSCETNNNCTSSQVCRFVGPDKVCIKR